MTHACYPARTNSTADLLCAVWVPLLGGSARWWQSLKGHRLFTRRSVDKLLGTVKKKKKKV